MTHRLWIVAISLAITTAGSAFAATPKCAAQTSCVENRSFVATVTGVRTSKQGSTRVLTATVRFENKTAKPLTIGYVKDSGIAMDELGNRYLVPGANAVRAIGEISGTAFDPKFTLQPGEGSDARFELSWDAGTTKAKAGAAFELDLAIREIASTGPDQFKLAQEHALHFDSLGQKTAAGPAVAAAHAAPTDPCAGSSRCYNAGAFIAEVMQVSPTAMAAGVRHHAVALNIRFRNISDKPIILAYQSGSSAGLDNFGNTFHWGRAGTHDTSVKGMGIVTGRSADTQFQLAPGQTRNATFNLWRYNARPPIGESWKYDVVIEEIEIQPGQVVKSVRQNSLNFTDLAPGSYKGAHVATSGSTGSSGASATEAALQDAGVPTDADSAAAKLIDALRKKTQKK
jgi:hypothetical protein